MNNMNNGKDKYTGGFKKTKRSRMQCTAYIYIYPPPERKEDKLNAWQPEVLPPSKTEKNAHCEKKIGEKRRGTNNQQLAAVPPVLILRPLSSAPSLFHHPSPSFVQLWLRISYLDHPRVINPHRRAPRQHQSRPPIRVPAFWGCVCV